MHQIIEFSIILFLIIFQSIFGVGLLLFGTPTFMLLEYSFTNTLSILLPISCMVSLTQYLTTKDDISKYILLFYKFAVPGLVIFIPFSYFLISQIYMKKIIALVMILFSLLSLFKLKNNKFRKIIKFNSRIYLFFLGSVHGLTNLGGGFVTIFSSIFYFKKKFSARKLVAFSYFVFGIIQILALIITSKLNFKFSTAIFMILVPLIFYIFKSIFNKMRFINYINFLYFLTLFYGVIILVLNA